MDCCRLTPSRVAHLTGPGWRRTSDIEDSGRTQRAVRIPDERGQLARHGGHDDVVVLAARLELGVLPRFHGRFKKGCKLLILPGDSASHPRIVASLDVVEQVNYR